MVQIFYPHCSYFHTACFMNQWSNLWPLLCHSARVSGQQALELTMNQGTSLALSSRTSWRRTQAYNMPVNCESRQDKNSGPPCHDHHHEHHRPGDGGPPYHDHLHVHLAKIPAGWWVTRYASSRGCTHPGTRVPDVHHRSASALRLTLKISLKTLVFTCRPFSRVNN